MLQGTIKKIAYQGKNDWGVYHIDCAGKVIKAVGIIPSASIGMRLCFEGIEEKSDKYGKSFKITHVLSVEADEFAGIRRFLADGYMKGIGVTKANAIIEMYGNESLDLFDSPEGIEKLKKVKGLSEKSINNIMSSYEENKKFKNIVMFLNGTGTKNQIEHIYEKYGDKAVDILKKNPYRLQMDLDGFGFKKADSIALASGIKKGSIERIMACVKYILEEAASSGGHCYLTYDEIKAGIMPILAPDPKGSEEISDIVIKNVLSDYENKRENFIEKRDPSSELIKELDETVEIRNLIENTLSEAIIKAIDEGDFVNYEGRIYTAQMYKAESEVAKILKEMSSENPVRFISQEKVEKAICDVEKRKTEVLHNEGKHFDFVATKEQRDAAYMALMHRISIISGGPGRGKTAISEIVAHGFMMCGKQYNKEDIIMLAPTGRAAQRMTESTGYSAMTIHRAVLSVKKNLELPKDKLILVDEASMVDIFLMLSVLRYGRNCNMVFVGDVDQIASVGPGKVLRDMISSNVIPCKLLTMGHRNTGTIAHNSELINNGVHMDRYAMDEHFVYVPILRYQSEDNKEDNRLKNEFQNKLINAITNDYKAMVNKYGITNVMLCAAMRERGPASVSKLNSILQEAYTKGNCEANLGNGRLFRVGDRVMQTKNDYSFLVKRNGEVQEGIFNGERGTITSISYDAEEDDYKIIVKFDDNSLGGYTKASAINLTLAYATTLHKCQGSEADCMMMVYTYSDYILLNRALFYTGETRAKKEFRAYGEEQYKYGKVISAFDQAVDKVDDKKRNTSLAEMLNE